MKEKTKAETIKRDLEVKHQIYTKAWLKGGRDYGGYYE